VTRVRRRVVLVSVALFALALGVALGGGPLQRSVQGTLQTATSPDGAADARALARRNRTLVQAARLDRGFAQAMAPELLEGRLEDRPVLLLSLPGVPERVGAAVAEDVEAAGGSVTSRLALGTDLVDPTARPLVDELSRRLLPELESVEVGEDASVYQRMGALAGHALLTDESAGQEIGDQARSVLNTLTTARLLRGADPPQRASTAVVLLPEPQQAGDSGARGLILTELVQALDAAGKGVVVAGPTAATRPGGLLAAVRRSALTAEDVSTVDGTGARTGILATVLALDEQLGGDTGHYGAGPGADDMLPPGAGTG
jgi:hypothetical protein